MSMGGTKYHILISEDSKTNKQTKKQTNKQTRLYCTKGQNLLCLSYV